MFRENNIQQSENNQSAKHYERLLISGFKRIIINKKKDI